MTRITTLFTSVPCIAVLCFAVGYNIALFVPSTNPMSVWTQQIHKNVPKNSSRSIENPIHLCMLVRAYGAHVSYLPVFAISIFHTGFDNIRIYMFNTDKKTDLQSLSNTINLINQMVDRSDFITLLELGVPIEKDFGYRLTDRALTYFYNQYNQSSTTCQYLIITNADNFYLKNLGNKTFYHMQSKKDIIAWNFVSRFYHPSLKQNRSLDNSENSEFFDDGTAKCLQTEFKRNRIDLGAAAYRLEFLYEHRLYFRRPREMYFPGSDGLFVERAVNLTKNKILIRQTLFVHQ